VFASDTQGPDCGGEQAYTTQGAQMTCTFDDEFSAATGDASQLDTSKWVAQVTANSGYTTGDIGGQACYVNSPNNIAVSNGVLNLTARREAAPFDCGTSANHFSTQLTAGMVSTYDKFSQQYGRYEVRAKLPSSVLAGLQETLWLWPVNDNKYGSWPSSGEIDFAEFYSDFPNLDVPYLHYNYNKTTAPVSNVRLPFDHVRHHSPEPNRHHRKKHHNKKKHPNKKKHHKTQRTGNPAAPPAAPGANQNVVTSSKCTINRGQFNTYAVDWSPGTITIEENGQNCITDNYQATGLASPAPFDQPFIIALTQAVGSGLNAYVPLVTPLPATTQVDYVRAWS
jgi:beta-glucanase (GH16 family)